MLLIKDILEKYEKNVPQKELEKIVVEIGKKHGIEIKNAGNEALGFIPYYTAHSGNDEWRRELRMDLEKILMEKYG